MKNLFKIILLVLCLFLIGTQITFSQEVDEIIKTDEEVLPQDLEVSEPKLLPDNPFYFLKNWGRGIRIFFAFNPEKRAELRLKFANEKIIEAEKLAWMKRNPKIIEKTLESFQKDLAEIEKVKPDVLKKFSEKLIQQQLLHQRILQKLETQVPPEVLQKIKENRERHLERFAKVMEKVESGDKIADRLESTLEKIKGSKFKEFKNLEILEEIKEKMPEDVRQKIEEKQTAIIEKFTEKLEGLSDEEKEKFKDYLEKISGDKLKHLEIISNLESEEISDKLRDVMGRVKEKKIEEVEKEDKKITDEKAQEIIKKAEDQIAIAEEKIKEISEEEYGGGAAKRLLELAKTHLEKAKEAFDEGKYGRAFGLTTAAYHEALNIERIVEKLKVIKESPEKLREKLENLYPGIELPEDITRCRIPPIPRCLGGKIKIEKTPEDCPVLKCEEISKELGACTTLWDPVCGKDGKTYSNECFAKAAGVEIDYKGVCKEIKEKLRERLQL